MNKNGSIRKSVLVMAMAMGLAAWGVSAGAQAQSGEYPQRSIRLVTPSGPGAITDQTARLLADGLTKALGQSVVVENKPGANGILASEMVARAAPDGYTLLYTYAATHTVNPWLIKNLSYDPVADFTPIVMASGGGGNVLLVSPELGVKSLADLIKVAKSSKEGLSYCSWGMGSGGHIAMEYLKAKAGIELTHIPYKGAPQCVNDLAGGHVKVAFADTVSPLPFIRSGQVVPIAISGPIRIGHLGDVPTMTEQGVEFKAASWSGILGPKGLPPEVVTRVNEAVNTIITSPEQRERFLAMNLRPGERNSPEEFAQFLRDDIARWGDAVKLSGLKPE